jgi:hypothetical protein
MKKVLTVLKWVTVPIWGPWACLWILRKPLLVIFTLGFLMTDS